MAIYAITGASGFLGNLAVEELLARGVPAPDVVAVVRTPSKVAGLAARGVQVREADYTRPKTLNGALASVDRVLLVSTSWAETQPGDRVAHHTNVIEAAIRAGVSRIVYTSILMAEDSTNPLADEHRDTERVLHEADVPVTLLRNGYYTENYSDQLDQYLQRGEILGATGRGRISAATRRDYAAAAAAALLEDAPGNRTYELGGTAFDLSDLARTVSDITGTAVAHRDLPVEEYVVALKGLGLDDRSARFAAALDESVARGDLETESEDLARLIDRPPTPLSEVLRTTHRIIGVDTPRDARAIATTTIGFIGAGNIGGALASLAVQAGYDVVLSNSRGPETLSTSFTSSGPRRAPQRRSKRPQPATSSW